MFYYKTVKSFYIKDEFCYPLSHILSKDLNAHYAEAAKAYCLSLWSSNSKILFYKTQKKSFIRKKKRERYFDKHTFLVSFCATKIELKGKVIGRPFKKNMKYLLAVSSLIFQKFRDKRYSVFDSNHCSDCHHSSQQFHHFTAKALLGKRGKKSRWTTYKQKKILTKPPSSSKKPCFFPRYERSIVFNFSELRVIPVGLQLK